MTARMQALLVLAASTVVFLPMLNAPFLNWDDTYYVTNSARTQTAGWAGLAQIWSMDDVWDGRFFEYFPVRDTVYWLTYQLFGKNSLPFHLVSVGVHAAATLSLFWLSRQFAAPTVALVGALFFATHPIHVESVAWVAGLKDPLCFLFCIGCVGLYERYRHTFATRHYAAALACLLAALTCKSLALGILPVLLGLELFTEPQANWSERALRLFGPVLIGCGFAFQFVLMGKLGDVVGEPHGGSWSAHVLLMAWTMLRYVQQAFVPVELLFHYCFDALAFPNDARTLALGPAYAALVAGLWAMIRSRSPLTLWAVWFFSFLLPVANIVPFTAVMADRYLYAPSAGTCVMAAWGLTRVFSGQRLGFVTAAIVAVFSLTTLSRSVVWRSERDLFAEVVTQAECARDGERTSAYVLTKYATLETDPRVALHYFGLGFGNSGFSTIQAPLQCPKWQSAGLTAGRLGEWALADVYSQKAVTLCPKSARSWAVRAQVRMGRDPTEAVDAAQRAYALSPTEPYWRVLERARTQGGTEPEGLTPANPSSEEPVRPF